MIIAKLVLVCECGEADIKPAEHGFNARVIRVDSPPS